MTRQPIPDMFAEPIPTDDPSLTAMFGGEVSPVARIDGVSGPYQLFDPLTVEEYAALKADIAEHGILVPVEVDELGHILDGHHRVKAWQELKAEGVDVQDYPRIVRLDMTEDEKRRHARVLNLMRRHLSKTQMTPHFVALRQNGMGLEDIAKATGKGYGTVQEALSSAYRNRQADLPATVVGKDGKTYPTQYQPRRPAVFANNKRTENAAKKLQGQVVDDLDRSVMDLREGKRIVKQQSDEKQLAQVVASVSPVEIPWLLVGDFRSVGQQVPDASVDLIFTDPPYDEAASALFDDLAQFAARVLKPGGILLTYSGQLHLPQIYAAMGQHLQYMWTCAIGHGGGANWIRKWHLLNQWKPILMYGRPPIKRWWANSFADYVIGGKEKADHEWQQALGEALHYIQAVCPPSGVVCDPFLGSGTTALAAKRLGMQYIGIEKDPATAAKARIKVEGNHQ